MDHTFRVLGCRWVMTAALAIGVGLAAQAAVAHGPASSLVGMEVFDRTTGSTLTIYDKDGERYVAGAPGHEYAVRIRNRTGGRVLAVTSVDGVNVVSGESASPNQSGYVIDAFGSVEIAGWRRSLERTAAFYFTDLGDSYAARTGRPANVGVIGVAVFRERLPVAIDESLRDKLAAHDAASGARGDRPAAAPEPEARREASADRAESKQRSIAKLGTGFGRSETSLAEHVRFERASALPADTIAIRYDRQENLIAMGVLRSPRYAERTPDPFPGMRFVPEPR